MAEEKTIGENIKHFRKIQGMTQKELGARLGLKYQAIAQWENDLRKPKIENLSKIALALNTSVISLMGISLSDISTKDLLAELERRIDGRGKTI